MKQVIQSIRTGETQVLEVPAPSPQAGEVLVRTAASLVSAGTERMIVSFAEKSLLGKARSRPDLVRQTLDKARREGVLTTLDAVVNRLDQPMALGYSSAGTVVALGEGVQGLKVGQRVACGGGGYAVHAEYAAVPRLLVAQLPDEVDFDSAAFTTLGAIALHGFRLAETGLSERVLVIGLGLLGLLAAEIANAAGCQVLGVDLDPGRVALAETLGIRAVIRPQAIDAALSSSRGKGFDAVLICADTSTNDPLELAGQVARDRARVIAIGAVGLQVPRKLYYEKELILINSRSYGPGRYDPAYEEGGQDYPIGYVRWTEGRNMVGFIDLLADRRLTVLPLISHRFPIDRATEAYELITGKRQDAFLGVLLTYPDTGSLAGAPSSEVGHTQEQPATTIQPARIRPTGIALGVLGAGNFATAVMLPAIKKLSAVELVGIASASGASAQHAASRYGFRYATSDEGRILTDPQVNTVAILTRHHLHSRQVLAALAAGKHVFCEKPLALHPDELQDIEAALDGSPGSPILTVGFNRRFAPLAQQLKEFLAQRGEPLAISYRVNAGAIPLGHWTQDPGQGGGRILGEACHFIDFLVYLVGKPPQAVTAFGLPDAGQFREDNVILHFSFPDGSLGMISYLANGDKSYPKERVEVFGASKVGVLDDFRTLNLVQGGKRRQVSSRLRQDKGHRAEWAAFQSAILEGGQPPIPYSHLFGVTRAAFAAVESLRTQSPVKIA